MYIKSISITWEHCIWKYYFLIALALFSLSINYNFVITQANFDTFTYWDQKKQKRPPIYSNFTFQPFTKFSDPLFIKTPVYLGPKISKPKLEDFIVRLCFTGSDPESSWFK